MSKLEEFIKNKMCENSIVGETCFSATEISKWVKEYNDLVYGLSLFSKIENSGIEFYYTGLETGEGKNIFYYTFNGVKGLFKHIDSDNSEIYASMEIRMKYGIYLNPDRIIFNHDRSK